MSARREHTRRYYLRLEYDAQMLQWWETEPPRWRVFSWRRWMARKPVPCQKCVRQWLEKKVKLRRSGA